MNALQGRLKYGEIRSGQYWQKRDNRMIMQVISKQRNGTWRVAFIRKNANSSHKVKEMVIYKYYDRL